MFTIIYDYVSKTIEILYVELQKHFKKIIILITYKKEHGQYNLSTLSISIHGKKTGLYAKTVHYVFHLCDSAYCRQSLTFLTYLLLLI